MISKQYRIGLCSSTVSLVEQVRRIAAELSIDLDVATSSLDNIGRDARRMEAEGVEVFLAGSVTAPILSDCVKVPVVHMQFQSVDAMENVARAAKLGKKIFIPNIRERLAVPNMLTEMLGLEVGQATFEDEASLRNALKQAKEDGYEIVMGGGFMNKCARELGLATVDYIRPDYMVREAVNSATTIIRSQRQASERSHRYRTILDAASDGMVAVDKSGRITAINRTACELLGFQESEVLGKPVSDLLPKSTIGEALAQNSRIFDSIEKFKQKSFVWNHRPFEVAGDVAGCVSTFSEIASVIRSENKIRRTLSKGHVARYVVDDILHQSDVMRDMISDAIQCAKTDSNLLVTGETGTGKEVLVQSIHNLSGRRKMPFVSINCAALPDQLLESELFGHEEGAFTGSRKGGKAGLFELAHKGTILLDEIGETSENVQIRLLRVLQEREIMRLGDDRLISIDVRMIAASNRDLAGEVRNGNFRSDLYFRLNILHIHIPPLRERLEDIPILLKESIRLFSGKNGLPPFDIPVPYLEQLKKYPWPGNVRQLQNFTERLVLFSHSEFNHSVFDKIFNDLIDQPIENAPSPTQGQPAISIPEGPIPAEEIPESEENNLKKRAAQLKLENEKKILLMALESVKYSKTKAAKALGMSRSTFWKKMKKAGLE